MAVIIVDFILTTITNFFCLIFGADFIPYGVD